MTTTTNTTAPAAYATETLYTDTRAYDVVARTAATITIRPRTVTDEIVRREDWSGNGYPQVWRATKSDENGPTRVLRRRKDGTYRVAPGARPLRFSDEEPTAFTDYRM